MVQTDGGCTKTNSTLGQDARQLSQTVVSWLAAEKPARVELGRPGELLPRPGSESHPMPRREVSTGRTALGGEEVARQVGGLWVAHGGAGNRRSCVIEKRERGRKKRADERSEAADQQNGSWEGEWRMENDEWDRDWCECEERERVATLRRVPTCRTWRARVVWCCETTRRPR